MGVDYVTHILAGWQATTEAERIRHSCVLLAVAFCLHTVADPALTYLGVVHLEIATEANPFIEHWLQAGLWPFIAIHLPVYALGAGSIMCLRWLYQAATPREQELMYYSSMIGFSGLILWGAILILNSLFVLWIALSGTLL